MSTIALESSGVLVVDDTLRRTGGVSLGSDVFPSSPSGLPLLTVTSFCVPIQECSTAQMTEEWLIYSLVSVSAFVFCVSSALLYARYTSRHTPPGAKAEDEIDTRETVKLMYGTQTGTAEKFAKQAASALNAKYGGHTRFAVVDVEDLDPEQMGVENLMIFMLATYGDGEPTDNAFALDGWLQRAAEDVMNGDRDMVLKVCWLHALLTSRC